MTVETKYELTVPLFGTGRSLKIFSIKKITTIMAQEKFVKIKITNAVGIAYAKGLVYEVTEEEAKNLISKQKAIPFTEDEAETAAAKQGKKETR